MLLFFHLFYARSHAHIWGSEIVHILLSVIRFSLSLYVFLLRLHYVRCLLCPCLFLTHSALFEERIRLRLGIWWFLVFHFACIRHRFNNIIPYRCSICVCECMVKSTACTTIYYIKSNRLVFGGVCVFCSLPFKLVVPILSSIARLLLFSGFFDVLFCIAF